MQVKNVSPHTLDVPALRRVVEPGEVVDVPDDLADGFAGQDQWQIVKKGGGDK